MQKRMKLIDDHPEYKTLATRHDDLKHILLKYSASLGEDLAGRTIAEYQLVNRRIKALTKKLGKQGYVEVYG